ncbi:MAG: hypothetical protein B5M51_07560 [Anaerolinea sp. 4484_236]|nr:MAG: hypothetical protein B5M51_07560 [Anaerolinea sp. 4484_236]
MPCPLNCRTMMTKWEVFYLLLGKTRFLQWSLLLKIVFNYREESGDGQGKNSDRELGIGC